MATVQEFTISDTLWERLSPHLPVHVPKPHPLGCHRRRVPDRDVLTGIFFVLRTGCQWKALSATGICSSSTAHRRFQQWVQAGVFARLWDVALQDYEDRIGLDFDWLSLDGSLHKAPLGGEKNRRQPLRPPQERGQAEPTSRSARAARRPGPGRGQPARHEADRKHVDQFAPGR